MSARTFYRRQWSTALSVATFALVALPSYGEQTSRRDSFAALSEQSQAGTRFADLEQGFWICDYAATAGGVTAVASTDCSIVTENLKNLKFDGDFERMLQWWRERKPAEHDKLMPLDCRLPVNATMQC